MPDLNGTIDIIDATAVQKYIVKLITLSDKALIAAARCDADGENDIISVKDATYIQMYAAKLDGHANVGTYYEPEVTPTTAPLPSLQQKSRQLPRQPFLQQQLLLQSLQPLRHQPSQLSLRIHSTGTAQSTATHGLKTVHPQNHGRVLR
mgnify:CR=1 FL=1